MQAHDLPVYRHRELILDALKTHQVIVVESPTGSGKTTQLPVILHEAGYSASGIIGVTQPRRIAAVSVAGFIKKQLDSNKPSNGPDLVGYKMRFDDRTTRSTRIKIMTDGILLQELKLDWTLSSYSVIMVDEAHERSLNIDFVLGLLKRVLELRKDFKVIVSSATINAEIFSQYFGDCPVVRIDTETHPVSIMYAPLAKQEDEALITKIGDLVGHILEEKREGDILVFLPGEKLIKDAIANMERAPYRRKLHIVPLYGRLPKEEQDLVFLPAPRGKVKVIVSTNISETSVTIDGITSVLDSGRSKINFYNPRTYTSTLMEKPISRASANQRKGRAGRTRPGTCYRLYSKEDFESRPLFTQEEIYRTDLSEVVLRMAELGIRDFESFDFISSPGRQGIAGAVESLLLLEALNPDNSLSEIGKMMALFPLLPRHSRIIVEAIRQYPDVLEEALIGTAFLSCDTPFTLPPGQELEARHAHHAFRDPAGDFVSYLRLFRAFTESEKKPQFCEKFYLDNQSMAEIVNVKEQLEQIVGAIGVPVSHGGPVEHYICSIAKGLMQFICFRAGKGYQSLTAEKVDIHPSSNMYKETPRYIVAGEIVRTSRMYARSVSPIKHEWLRNISSELAKHLGDENAAARIGKSGLSLISGGAVIQSLNQSLNTGGKATKAETGMSKEAARQSGKGKVTPNLISALPPGAPGAPPLPPNADPALTISLAGRIFQLQPSKGKKKLLALSWEEASWLAAHAAPDALNPASAGLRSAIKWENTLLLEGEKLERVLAIARNLNLPDDVLAAPVLKSKLSVWENLGKLQPSVESILKVARLKKGQPEFGFVTLFTNQDGDFWSKAVKGYTTALSESLASLEFLADQIDAEAYPELAAEVGKQYRRLSAILEEV